MNLQKILNDTYGFLRQHGFRLFTAIVTGALTYYAGIVLTGQWLYAITLVLLAEGLSLYWPSRMEAAQSAGSLKDIHWAGVAQWSAAITGIILAWVSIIVTDLATATIIASEANLLTGIFKRFEVVPGWAQNVVVYVLPVLAVSHGVLLTIFYVTSPEAAASRLDRKRERETRRKIRDARAKAKAEEAKARASAYERMAIKEAKKLGEAKAASMVQEEFTRPVQIYNAETRPPPKAREAVTDREEMEILE